MKTLGLDVGTHSVKAVLLSRGWLGTRVLDTVVQPIGEGDPETVARDVLLGFVERADAVAVSLDRRHLVARELELPFSDPAQIDQAFPYAAEGRIPMALQDAMVDYRIEETRPGGGSRVMVLAFPRAGFEKRLDVVEKVTGSQPHYHVDAFANANVLLEGEGASPNQDDVLGLLDVGATKACFDLFIDRRPVFTRTFLTAGAGVTRALARDLDLPEAEAEPIKVEGLAGGGKPVSPTVIQAATPVYTRLAQDVQHSLRAFHEKHPGKRLKRLFLTGGSAQAAFLSTFLADHLGVETRPLSPAPLTRACGPGTASLPFTTAYGLALWSARVGRIHIDLIRQRSAPLLLRPANLALLGAACLLLMGFHYYSITEEWDALNRQREALEKRIVTELSTIRRAPLPEVDAKADVAALDKAIRETRSRSEILAPVESSVLEVLDRLSTLIPRNQRAQVQIEHVLLQENDLKVSGRADSYEVVDRVKAALKGSGFFTDVRLGPLSNQRRIGPKRLRFQIELSLKGVKS